MKKKKPEEKENWALGAAISAAVATRAKDLSKITADQAHNG